MSYQKSTVLHTFYVQSVDFPFGNNWHKYVRTFFFFFTYFNLKFKFVFVYQMSYCRSSYIRWNATVNSLFARLKWLANTGIPNTAHKWHPAIISNAFVIPTQPCKWHLSVRRFEKYELMNENHLLRTMARHLVVVGN